MFLKCCCHTTAAGLVNFPLQLESQIANSFLKEGHLLFCFPNSHSRLLLTLHCQPLPSCVALHLQLHLYSFQPPSVSHPPSLHSKKIYILFLSQNKGFRLFYLVTKNTINNRSSASERVIEANVFQTLPPQKKKKEKEIKAVKQLAKMLSQLAKQSSLSDTNDMGRNRKNTN